jgi:hypothetical protein
MTGLEEHGFGKDQMAEMQRVINAENSDLFDVLAYVAYAMPTMTREERADQAKVIISERFTSKQQAFLDFVLAHYVQVGVEELAQEKLTPLLRAEIRERAAGCGEGSRRGVRDQQAFLGLSEVSLSEREGSVRGSHHRTTGAVDD